MQPGKIKYCNKGSFLWLVTEINIIMAKKPEKKGKNITLLKYYSCHKNRYYINKCQGKNPKTNSI